MTMAGSGLKPGSEGGKASILMWLLEGDPSIRWQVLADLVDASAEEIDAERARVAVHGWGARLLAAQCADGRWSGALYSPKWTSTTYTLLLPHWLGLPAGHPQAVAGCSWLCDQQLADGGWNCESVRSGSRHGSFNTSISALDALLEYQRSGGGLQVAGSMDRGCTFFLDHQLYRSHRTGKVVNAAFTRFPFPPQWHFDILRGLEHFRAAGATADPRCRRPDRQSTAPGWDMAGISGIPRPDVVRMEEAGPSR